MAQQTDNEFAAIMERARQRRVAAQVVDFVQSFKALVRKLPKPPAPKKSGRKGEDEDARAQPHRHLFAKHDCTRKASAIVGGAEIMRAAS